MNADWDSASHADWQIASQREGALKVLLSGSSPLAVAEVATDIRLSSAAELDPSRTDVRPQVL